MRKFIAIILALCAFFSLAACGTRELNAHGSVQSGTQDYTQRRYIQQKIMPPNKYERIIGLSVSNLGAYVENTFIDDKGESDISAQILDDKNTMLKELDEKEKYGAEKPNNAWMFPVSTRIMNDGRLVVLRCVVPKLDDGNDDWDHTRSVADIIDWAAGTHEQFELDAELSSASNKILYDGEHIGFYNSQVVGIYQTNGEPIGIYRTQNLVEHACFMADGSVAVLEFKQGPGASDGDMGQLIRFDPKSGEAEGFMTPPVRIVQLLDAPYDEEFFSFYIDDGSGIKGITADKENLDILNWTSAGVIGRAIKLEALSGRRFAYLDMNGAVILKPTDVDMSQIITLRLGTLNPFPIVGLVAEFNQMSEKYQIELVDYSKMHSADGSVTEAALLDMDIVSGKGPDMFDLSSLPMKKYQQAGLLEDLYPYIRTDERLKNVKLLQGPIKAMETDGKLYVLAPAYGIRTFVGDPEYTGIERLDIPALEKLYGLMEDGANPFGAAISRSSFLEGMLNLSSSQFADWDSLKCDFNVSDFAALLEMSKQLPDQEDSSSQISKLYTGEQMLSLRNILCIDDLVVFNSYLHENMKLYGLPTVPGQGTAMMPLIALGISVNCQDKQGAWEFLSSLLSDEYQKSLAGQALPLTQAGFDYIAQDHIDWVTVGGEIITADPLGNELHIKVSDERFIDMLQDAINSIAAVYNNDSQIIDLVLINAQAFFADDITAQTAAEHIQSRAQIYMAEQYG